MGFFSSLLGTDSLSLPPIAACARTPARTRKVDLYHRRFDEKSKANPEGCNEPTTFMPS